MWLLLISSPDAVLALSCLTLFPSRCLCLSLPSFPGKLLLAIICPGQLILTPQALYLSILAIYLPLSPLCLSPSPPMANSILSICLIFFGLALYHRIKLNSNWVCLFCIEIVFCKSGLDRYTLKSVDEVVVMFSCCNVLGWQDVVHCNISYYDYNLAVWL